MRVAWYLRVSKQGEQTPENQRLLLAKWTQLNLRDAKVTEFVDECSTRKTRPQKEELMQRCRKNEFDVVVFARLDRFARSSIELITSIDELVKRGVRVVATQQGYDFSKEMDATARLQFQIFAAFAEFEREIIRERIFEGLQRAKTQGKLAGRPRVCGDCRRARLETGLKFALCKTHLDLRNAKAGGKLRDATGNNVPLENGEVLSNGTP